MNDIEIQQVNYSCTLLGETAHITLTYKYLPTGRKKILYEFDCKDCYSCGVAKEGPVDQWTFKWDKCIHPLSPKK